MTVRNRIIMEPHQTGLTVPGEDGGHVTDALLAYYKAPRGRRRGRHCD